MHIICWSVIGILGAAVGAYTTVAQGAACPGRWEPDPPFEQFQMHFDPYTVELPVRANAPRIDAVEFSATRCLILAMHTTYDLDFLPLIAAWAALPEPRVAAGASLPEAKIQDLRQALGSSDAFLITDPQATILCAECSLGPRPGGVRFLVDRSGTVVYR